MDSPLVIENKELSLENRLLTAAKLLGYKRLPVSIDQFIEDDYYLGRVFGNNKLFPYWKEKLMELFPSPIHTKYFVVLLTGAIGTGKSTFSRICSLYLQHRLDCLKDPYWTLGIAPGKDINFIFFHVTGGKADSDFVTPNNRNKEMSPYFSGGLLNPGFPMSDVVDGARSNNSIGGDSIFHVLSELNFVRPDVAEYKLDQSFKRIKSRFLKVIGYFPLVIIDTSARGDESIADQFIRENPFDEIMTVRASIWEAKKHLGIYGRKGWFKVYAGDSTHLPFIVENENKITEEMDKSRIINAPMELISDFRYNIVSSLQDMAGISTTSTGKLIDDPEKVKTQFCLNMYTQDIIAVDFYNKKDKLIYRLERYLKDIPEDKIIFPRYDIGVVGDNAGLAITYFDKFIYFDGNEKVRMPVYRTPLMIAINRLEDQETSIYHLYEFIMDINDKFEIGEFSADQFASRQLMQDLSREGIKTRLISVDRTDTPYIYFKNMVMNKLWYGANNKLALKELCGLNSYDGKVDHPNTFSDGTKGSKDIMDAVCGSVWSCYENLDLATQVSERYRIKFHTDNIKNRVETSKSSLDNLASFMFGVQ